MKFNQTRGAQVQFPGSQSYHQAQNSVEFADVDPADIVKVTGSPAACKEAIDLLKVSSITVRSLFRLMSSRVK